MLLKRNLHLLSYLPAYKVFPPHVRRRYLRAYKAPISMALWTKASLCVKSSLLEQSLPRTPSQQIRSLPTYQVGPRNPCNPWLIKGLRLFTAFYNCRDTFTDVMSALQIHLFMQNKANFQKSQMNVNNVLTRDYEKMTLGQRGKNKPNSNPIQTQFKPNQSQNKPNTNPNKPNLSRRSLWRSRIKRYLAKMAHHELKYVDRLAQLTLNQENQKGLELIMKKLWINIVPYNKEIAIAALESGAEAVVLPDGDSDKVRQFGKIKTVEKNGDIKPGVDVEFIDIAGKDDEDKAAAVPADKTIVVKMLDWTIIPIENLLARRGKNIMVQVETSEQAKLMVEILEKGVDGVVLNTTDINEIKKTAEIIHGISEKVALVTATITSTKQLGMGDRACLDTCTQMTVGEGMLVGNTAAGFFLVHSESIDNPYVASRPFRVNAGAVHAYTLVTGGKTKYLADLKAGDEVLLVDFQGNNKTAYLGRNKIEKRPMMLIEAEAEGEPITLVLQNAETIRLVSPDGDAISVTNLKPGDKVLGHIEKAGRHFGMKVDETLIEK